MKMDWYCDSDEENHKYNSDRATWPPFSIRESTFFFKFRLRTYNENVHKKRFIIACFKKITIHFLPFFVVQIQIFKVTVWFIIEKTQNCSRTFIGRVS